MTGTTLTAFRRSRSGDRAYLIYNDSPGRGHDLRLWAMVHVTIFSRQDCHLCETAMQMARRLQAEIPFRLDWIDIDADHDLVVRYGSRIPVVVVDQTELRAEPLTERELRRAIKRARWRGPVSRILSCLGLRPKQG